MDNKPFFSVIIPTKNRSHLVGFAVQSVLNQTFDKYEIIVCDNDDNEESTRDKIMQFQDKRVKYYRTGGLSMADNWEFGLTKTMGNYITILEDKMAFYPNSLEIIYKTIESGKNKVVTWNWDVLKSVNGTQNILIKYFGENGTFRISTEEILNKIVVDLRKAWVNLPRLITSCISREFANYIINKTPFKRLFIPICPDMNSAFIQLIFLENIVHIDKSLSIWHDKESNALSCRQRRGDTHKQFIIDSGGKELFYNYVPIKSYYIVANTVVNDFLRIKAILGNKLMKYDILPINYAKMCYNDIMRTYIHGGDIKNELILFDKYLSENNSISKKELQKYYLKVRIKSYINKYIFKKLLIKTPAITNIIFKMVGYKKRIYKGYVNILEVTKEKQFM